MHRIWFGSFFVLALAACDPAPSADAGLDAGAPLDGGEVPDGGALDVPSGLDAPLDAPPLDAPPLDAAPLDVTAEVIAALPIFCATAAERGCVTPWRCGCEASEPPELAACTAEVDASCDDLYRPSLTEVFGAAGVTVDRDAVAACVSALRSLVDRCLVAPTPFEAPQACLDAVVLAIPLGASCEPAFARGADLAPFRCAGGEGVCIEGDAGHVCTEVPTTSGEACSAYCGMGLACVDGTCTAPVALDGACGDHEDCASPEVCMGGVCGAPIPEGGACTDTARCATGLFCAGGSCTAGPASCTVGEACGSASECIAATTDRCVPVLASGEACFSAAECGEGLTCRYDAPVPPGLCAALPAEGASCADAPCAPGLVCIASGSGFACGRQRRLGESCGGRDWDGAPPRCEGELACGGTTAGAMPICEPPPTVVGGPCSVDERCGPGLECAFDVIGVRLRCQPAVPVGGTCTLAEDACSGDARCVESAGGVGTCTAPAREGESCDAVECAAGLDCRYFPALDGSVCQPLPTLGEACTGGCAPGGFCAPDPAPTGACLPSLCGALGGL